MFFTIGKDTVSLENIQHVHVCEYTDKRQNDYGLVDLTIVYFNGYKVHTAKTSKTIAENFLKSFKKTA